MNTLFWLLGLPALVWALLYFRASLLVGTALVAAALVFWSQALTAPWFAQILVWGLFLGVATILNVAMVRSALISNRALAAFRKVMPPMSQTEREALEAGSVWWDGELFSGKPDWQRLLDTPQPHLSAEEQAFIDGPADELCRMLDDWQITEHDYDLPPKVWQFIKDKGFLGMIIPKDYGGLGFSALAHSAVVMKIAGRSITAAVTVMVPNSLGPAELLLRYGTDEQKDQYLARLACGDEIPCFALTSPQAGSDAASMTDTGVVCRSEFNGEKDVLGVRLNWDKRYITLGPVATVLGLAFKLYDPERLIGDSEDVGITCALIPTGTKGVEIGRRHFPLNSAFQNGPNSGKDVFIPIDWIIGGASMAGQGWRMLMECLAAGRSISLPALATGAGKLASRATGAYGRVRRQFKTPIGRFEGVEEALARIAAGTYMMDAARGLTAVAIDQGESPSVVSAIAKYNLTEWMRIIINDAMDVQGGSGICMGPRNLLARAYQSIPISITVEGANILTRSLIIFGQGAIRCHPFVFKEIQAAKETDESKALDDFDQALFGHIGFTLSNAARTLWLGLTKASWNKTPVTGPTAKYYRQLTRFSSAFALVADTSMAVLGGSLKRKETLSGRLADVLSHLYLSSAVLKRFEDQGRQEEDLPLVQWWCEHSLRCMQQSLDKFLLNFPNRVIARVLRHVIFPWGKGCAGPSDRMGHQAASLLLTPSAVRDRLTAGMFLPPEDADQEQLTRLEKALNAVIAAEPAEKKLRTALKSQSASMQTREQQIAKAVQDQHLSQAEADTILHADELRYAAISVDHFDQAELGKGQLPTAPSNQECA